MTGCFGSDFKYKEAQFNREYQEVVNDLKALHDFENAYIKWSVSKFGQKVNHTLKVYLKNGRDIPEPDSLKHAIGKAAMQLVLNSIDNDTAYTDFVVYFISEIRNGTVNMKRETPFAYRLEEFD